MTDDRCREESIHAAGVDAWPGGWSVLIMTLFDVISTDVYVVLLF